MTSSVPSVERALAILELLASSRSGLTLPEIARRLDLPKSSAYCVLLTLERCGYLYRHEPGNRFRFAPKVFTLANTALNGIELREQAAPYLRSLAERTRLTAHLGVIANNTIVLIDKLEPPGVIRLATWIGKGMDLHASGLGKAILATWSEEQLIRLVREYGLTRHNEFTITSIGRLRKDLEEARRLGYAVDDEEGEIGFRCVGTAILDRHSKALGAISLAGRTAEIGHEDYGRLGALLREASEHISAALAQEGEVQEFRAAYK